MYTEPQDRISESALPEEGPLLDSNAINPGHVETQPNSQETSPQEEDDHLPDCPAFIEASFQRLRDKLTDSTPSEHDVFLSSDSKQNSLEMIPQEDEHLPVCPAFIEASFQRLREKLTDSTPSDIDVFPEADRKRHSVYVIPPVVPAYLTDCPEFIRAPFHTLRERLTESVEPDRDAVFTFTRERPDEDNASLAETEDVASKTKQHGKRATKLGLFQRRNRKRGDKPTVASSSTQQADRDGQTDDNDQTSHPSHRTLPENNIASSAMSINCTSCTINYNYVTPSRFGGLRIWEIAIVLAFAILVYVFRKS